MTRAFELSFITSDSAMFGARTERGFFKLHFLIFSQLFLMSQICKKFLTFKHHFAQKMKLKIKKTEINKTIFQVHLSSLFKVVERN